MKTGSKGILRPFLKRGRLRFNLSRQSCRLGYPRPAVPRLLRGAPMLVIFRNKVIFRICLTVCALIVFWRAAADYSRLAPHWKFTKSAERNLSDLENHPNRLISSHFAQYYKLRPFLKNEKLQILELGGKTFPYADFVTYSLAKEATKTDNISNIPCGSTGDCQITDEFNFMKRTLIVMSAPRGRLDGKTLIINEPSAIKIVTK